MLFRSNRDAVLFCGVMDYRPNHDAARWLLDDIWPRVQREHPHAVLTIAGSAPQASLRARAAGRADVRITGHVADVRPYFWQSAVFVAPLRLARGVQNKVLDAAVAGLPSVVTSTVYEGLPAQVRPA